MTFHQPIPPVRRSPELAAIRVDVDYPGRHGAVRALANVTLEVERGEFVAIVGRSGSGKSTLLRALGGLVRPSGGSVLLEGKAINGPPLECRFVEQDYTQSLLPWLTVEQNVAFGVKYAVKPNHGESGLVDRLIEHVGLTHARLRYPRELSGGMQQRVAIARALASQPEILLLDEAFSSVDALSRARLQDMVLHLQRTFGFTTVLVTHDIDEAVYLADRVAVMHEHGQGLAALVTIDLPRPRHQVATREAPRYLEYRRRLIERVLLADTKNED